MHSLCHIFMTLGLNFNTNSFGAPPLKKIKKGEELEKKNLFEQFTWSFCAIMKFFLLRIGNT